MTSGARIADTSDVGLEKSHVKDNSGDKVRDVIAHDVWCDLELKLHKLHLNNSKTIHMYVYHAHYHRLWAFIVLYMQSKRTRCFYLSETDEHNCEAFSSEM